MLRDLTSLFYLCYTPYRGGILHSARRQVKRMKALQWQKGGFSQDNMFLIHRRTTTLLGYYQGKTG